MLKNKKPDTRTKIILALIFSIIFSTTADLYILISGLAVIIFIILLLQKINDFLKYLKVILPMCIFFGIITLFLENYHRAIFSFIRLFDIFSIFFIFFTTTDIEDVADVFSNAGFPYYFSFILIAGFNFVPIIAHRLKNIIDAQRARGIDLENKIFILFKIRYFFPPFLIQSFKLAEELAESIETRGFGLIKKTKRIKNKFGFFDYILIIFSIALLLLYLYYNVFVKSTFS